MKKYWINNHTISTPRYNHEIHIAGCNKLPLANGTYLGMFEDCFSAMEAAREDYDMVNGCEVCVPECYSR